MRGLWLVISLFLVGCAATPEEMAQQSNWDVCRFTMGGPHRQTAGNEAMRRGLDCAPYYGPITAKLQAENAAVANFLNSVNRPAQQGVNCISQRMGSQVHTNCN